MAKEKPIRILALDISASPGYAVIEVKNGKPKLLVEDSIKTDTAYVDAERFAYVEAKTIQIIYEHGPFDYVCREHFLKGGSKRATQLVFGAWAAIDSALGRYGYHIPSDSASPYEIRNSRVKALVGGHGGDDKEKVAKGAKVVFGLPPDFKFKSNDSSDAAAIGYTFAFDKGLLTTETKKTGVDDDGKRKGNAD